ncbi:hypothetical protein FQN57_005130 [Myotisia sp. PD_48]|nr:hypothetical protein FQN57_005130 [Myotisia sp. PD_48]
MTTLHVELQDPAEMALAVVQAATVDMGRITVVTDVPRIVMPWQNAENMLTLIAAVNGDSVVQRMTFATTSVKATAYCTRSLRDPVEAFYRKLLATINHGVPGYRVMVSRLQPCHALTHLNYAFAYIDPQSFELTTMDSLTPERLFQETVGTKLYRSSLKVWLSVGGWTFSDNGTVTQPIFGNIARSEANRRKFAKNAVKFLNHYGFDGLDIDWEYPGAPDRGGKEEDIRNFVLLMRTLRLTFDSSPRTLGLTFTAPSSYWYLRWFDLPELLKYSDWINVMTYDLHGIELAMELFWRVKIPPSKLTMGFGFYGRSFELADSGCRSPGCPFRGGAEPGPCSATSGVLMYYEIQALLKQHPELKPVHDEGAAVKYLVFKDNQWVSYDDSDTFKQKINWANKIGIGGSIIWAADTDDDKYSAHSGLLGKALGHADLTLPQHGFFPDDNAIRGSLVGKNGQDCQIREDCTDQKNPQASGCGKEQWVGWERGRCGATATRSVVLRPRLKNVYGEVLVRIAMANATMVKPPFSGLHGEVSQQQEIRKGVVVVQKCSAVKPEIGILLLKAVGGLHGESGRDAHRYSEDADNSLSDTACPSGEEEVTYKYESQPCPGKRRYCCPKPAMLHDCHWVGTLFDCPDAKCAPDEVTLATSERGKAYGKCSWGRKRANCCKVKIQPPEPLVCDISICDIDPTACTPPFIFDLKIRDVESHTYHRLEKRGNSRGFNFFLAGLLAEFTMYSRNYPSRSNLFTTRAGLRDVLRRYFRLGLRDCNSGNVVGDKIADVKKLPPNAETEHLVPLSMHKQFITSANTGFVGTRVLKTLPISSAFFQNKYLKDDILPAGLPRVNPELPSRSPDLRAPVDRVFEALGSNTNRRNLVLTSRDINAIKGRIFKFEDPMSPERFHGLVTDTMRGENGTAEEILQVLRTTVAVFQYHQNSEIQERFQRTVNLVTDQLTIIETHTEGGTGLAAAWEEVVDTTLTVVEETTQTWVQERVDETLDAISNSDKRFPKLSKHLKEIKRQIKDMKFKRRSYFKEQFSFCFQQNHSAAPRNDNLRSQMRSYRSDLPTGQIQFQKLQKLANPFQKTYGLSKPLKPNQDKSTNKIRDDLAESGQTKWGWVIYRCTYEDDSAWEKFKEIILQDLEFHLSAACALDLLASADFTFRDDRTKFDSASIDTVLRYHYDWARSSEAVAERPPSARYLWSTRYEFCIYVDSECLKSVVDPSNEQLERGGMRRWGYVKMLYPGFSLPEREEEEEEDEEDRDEIVFESTDSEDGRGPWMNVGVYSLNSYYSLFLTQDMWHTEYTKPPLVALY